MSRMPLRYKMTLLYSSFSTLILIVLLLSMYWLVQQSIIRHMEDLLTLSYTQLAAHLEVENDQIVVEEDDELVLPPGAAYRVTDTQGHMLAEYQMHVPLDSEAFLVGQMREVVAGAERWLFLDGLETQEGFTVYIRVCLPMESTQWTLTVIRMIGLIAGPCVLLISILGGLWVSRRSLRPIDRIIDAAQDVAMGDLSKRVPTSITRDEIGELTRMINQMLDRIQESFDREKRFTADASHELRTPVSVILAYAEALALEVPQEGEAMKCAQAILLESARMQRIVTQLLTITRGEQKDYTIEHAAVDMGEVARSVAEQMEPLSREKGIDIRVKTAFNGTVTGDQSLLTQMMINLVDNAIRYGREGGWIDILVASAPSGQCRVVVADNGVGIATQHLPHIFERFYRTDQARDRTGTGLGLSIVAWIVRMHGGMVEARSEEGNGSAFEITL